MGNWELVTSTKKASFVIDNDKYIYRAKYAGNTDGTFSDGLFVVNANFEKTRFNGLFNTTPGDSAYLTGVANKLIDYVYMTTLPNGQYYNDTHYTSASAWWTIERRIKSGNWTLLADKASDIVQIENNKYAYRIKFKGLSGGSYVTGLYLGIKGTEPPWLSHNFNAMDTRLLSNDDGWTTTLAEQLNDFIYVSAPDGVYRNSPSYNLYGLAFQIERISLNEPPTLALNTANSQMFYEGDTFTIDGTVTDKDVGNIVNVYYQINSETARAIKTDISTGAAIPFTKTLTYKGGQLYDGTTVVTGVLEDGTAHQLKVWGEDNQGGKSVVQTKTFYAVPNRVPILVVHPLTPQEGMINNDMVTISGTASDPDGNNVDVTYKLNGGLSTLVYSGPAGEWSFDIQMGNLLDGDNMMTIEVTDPYSFKASKVIKIMKGINADPLLKSCARYEIVTPISGATGVLLWVRRKQGLTVTAAISMTESGVQEQYVPMTLNNSAAMPNTGGAVIEDEFIYQAETAKDKIIVQLTLTRESTEVSDSIIYISGVLS